MNTTDTAYTNTDAEYHEICGFLNALAAKDPHMHWESGRMNFWRYSVHGDKAPDHPFFRENARVWRAEDGPIVALFISEYGQNDFFVEVTPEYHAIYPDIFRWIDDHWARTRTSIEIDVFGDDEAKIRRLKAQGFEFKCHFENKRFYDLDQVNLAYVLPDGFSTQTFSESSNYASRVALVRSAFDSSRYTEDALRSLISSPDYIDAYDLSVVTPEGEHVAYCIGWPETARDHAGYIEPVGTHAAYRRRGLASAVIKECFRRMKANGLTTVEIASRAEPHVSNFLYDSLQPRAKREVHKYAKAVV